MRHTYHLYLLVLFSVILCAAAAGKRGLCIGDPFNVSTDYALFTTTPAVSWTYNWSPNRRGDNGGLEFVPMQWNGANIEKFEATVRGQCANHVLAFNEPDLKEQANMTPETACALWKKFFIPLKKKYGIRIGLPVISAGGGWWLDAFFKACPHTTNQADFLPLHWYGSGGVGGFYDFIWSKHQQFPMYPVWITEFADESKNIKDQVNFVAGASKYLDTLGWVERYSWFGTFRNNSNWPVATLGNHGGLSLVGHAYVETVSNNTAVTPYKC